MKALSKLGKCGLAVATIGISCMALTAGPVQATSFVSTDYHCAGLHGDAQDKGEWDWVFKAESEADARRQAIIKYTPTGPGGWAKVSWCNVLK